MKLASWNVNGLRACLNKGFLEYVRCESPDILCLQETKLQPEQAVFDLAGYSRYFYSAEKKGYSGTCIYTREEPLRVTTGIGIPEHETEGRVITLDMPEYYLVNVYTPNSQDGLRRLPYRMQWEDAFREYLCSLKERKGVIVCGDMNVAHEPIDLKNPDTNHFNAGFSDEERGKFSDLLAAGFTDSWRSLHPGEAKYSWWSYRMAARERNVGWRIDYFLVSNDLAPRIESADIHNEVYGSDHCPVELILK